MELEISPSPVLLSRRAPPFAVCSLFSPLQAPELGQTHISHSLISHLSSFPDFQQGISSPGCSPGEGGSTPELCHSTAGFSPAKEKGHEAEPPGHFQGVQTGMEWEKTPGFGWAELWRLENPWCLKKLLLLLLFQLNFLLPSFHFCPS